MQILEITFGRFPEIIRLNPAFRTGAKQVRVLLRVESNGVDYRSRFAAVFSGLTRWFPTLAHHDCCQWGDHAPQIQTDGIPLKTTGGLADVAHLVEHLMVDLHCRVGGMRRCSGVTCGYRKSADRFDLFVECPEHRLGRFSAGFATFLVRQLFQRRKVSRGYRRVLALARYLLAHPRAPLDRQKLSRTMGWTQSQTRFAFRKLAEFQFLENGSTNGGQKK